jgi:hypothetical protein
VEGGRIQIGSWLWVVNPDGPGPGSELCAGPGAGAGKGGGIGVRCVGIAVGAAVAVGEAPPSRPPHSHRRIMPRRRTSRSRRDNPIHGSPRPSTGDRRVPVIQRVFDKSSATVAEREEVVYPQLGGGAGEDGAELGFAREGELVSDVALRKPSDTERSEVLRG